MRSAADRRGPRLGALTVSHLHLPDGLLPVWLWGTALAIVLLLLALTGRGVEPRRVAYQGALAAMMLAAMAVPLGPLEMHLSLAGPVGVLLGPAASFQVMFVVSLILAFLGHGGLTTVGINVLVLSAAAIVAHFAYAALSRRLSPSSALGLATATGQTISGALWFLVVTLAMRVSPHPATLTRETPHLEVVSALMIALSLIGVIVESVVAFGIGRFLARVHPALLPSQAEGT